MIDRRLRWAARIWRIILAFYVFFVLWAFGILPFFQAEKQENIDIVMVSVIVCTILIVLIPLVDYIFFGFLFGGKNREGGKKNG